MAMLNINIPIPEELLFVLNQDEKTLQEEVRKIIAMQYFKDRKLSLGKAAELAGMEKNDFVTLLGKNRIDIYRYTEKELQKEFLLVDKLVEESKNESRN